MSVWLSAYFAVMSKSECSLQTIVEMKQFQDILSALPFERIQKKEKLRTCTCTCARSTSNASIGGL